MTTREKGIQDAIGSRLQRDAASVLDAGVRWVKSSRSNPNGECVEMARLPGGEVAVRNSRFPDGPALVFPRTAVAALVRGIRGGELEDLAG